MKWNPFESHDLIAIQKQRNPIIRWAIISIYSLPFWVIAMREIIKRLVWFCTKSKNCQEITLFSRYYVPIRIFRWPVPNERNNIQFSKVSDKYSAFRWVVATSRHGKLVLDFVVNDFMCSIKTKWNGFRLKTIYFYLYIPYGSWEPRTLICTMTIKDKLTMKCPWNQWIDC